MPPREFHNSNSDMFNEAALPSEVVELGPTKVNLQTGEKIAISSSKTLSR